MIKTRIEILHDLYNEIHSQIVQGELAAESLTEKVLEKTFSPEDNMALQKRQIAVQMDVENKSKGLARVGRWIQKEEKAIEKRVKEKNN
jgi:hypothetical protein